MCRPAKGKIDFRASGGKRLDIHVKYVYNVDGVVIMPMTPREMIRLLEANGFRQTRSNGSHFFFRNTETGKTTTVPKHAKDLKKGLEQKILKDAGLK